MTTPVRVSTRQSGDTVVAAGSVHAPHPGGGHVLVVDDSRMNRMTLVRLLERLGHETTEAADGREALDVLAAGRRSISSCSIS